MSVGRDLISRVTDAVMEDVRAWQQRPLDDVYPILYLDAFVVKIRDGGSVQRKACYLALGDHDGGRARRAGDVVPADRGREVLDAGPQRPQAARGQDILICCVDGLKGFPEAIEAIFPQTEVQTCIVHLIRTSLKYVPRRAIRPGRQGPQADLHRHRRRRSAAALEAFEEKWGERLPPVVKAWREAWEYVIPFMAFPDGVRRVIYTTNAIEALNRQLRKAIKTKGHFPNEEAARKLIYLA